MGRRPRSTLFQATVGRRTALRHDSTLKGLLLGSWRQLFDSLVLRSTSFVMRFRFRLERMSTPEGSAPSAMSCPHVCARAMLLGSLLHTSGALSWAQGMSPAGPIVRGCMNMLVEFVGGIDRKVCGVAASCYGKLFKASL